MTDMVCAALLWLCMIAYVDSLREDETSILPVVDGDGHIIQ